MPIAQIILSPAISSCDELNPLLPEGGQDLESRISYGPVPSRRLGMSIGINNIPAKHCTCSCGYCQVGRTTTLSIEPSRFHGREAIIGDVSQRVSEVRAMGGAIDYLTFVADGEPTLDMDLALEIEALKGFGIPVAVITNGTLLWREDVAEALGKADWVSVKVDTVDEYLWRRVDRPHPGLDLEKILEGIGTFAGERRVFLATETMLIGSMNDGSDAVTATADFIGRMAPDIAYISIPHRPPAERRFRVPSSASLKRALGIFPERIDRVELLGAEDDTFVSTGDPRTDILSISSVHPMDASAMNHLLGTAGSGWKVVDELVAEGELAKTLYRGRIFYSRRPGKRGPAEIEGAAGR